MGDLRKIEDEFFANWKNEFIDKDNLFFVQDGAIDAELYSKSKTKIMSLMKETPFDKTAANGYVFGDGVNNRLKINNRYKFQKGRDAKRYLAGRIACVREVFINKNNDFSFHQIQGENINSQQNINYFRESAYINLKKYNGKPKSEQKDLENVINKDREKLKTQINKILTPDIILCSMKIHYYKMINNGDNQINFLKEDENKMVKIFEEIIGGSKKRLIIEMYHPSYFKIPEPILIEKLKKLLIEIS